jgi:hypothetical protein
MLICLANAKNIDRSKRDTSGFSELCKGCGTLEVVIC